MQVNCREGGWNSIRSVIREESMSGRRGIDTSSAKRQMEEDQKQEAMLAHSVPKRWLEYLEN